MSPASVHRTCPTATLFRPAVLHGFERTFNLVSISGIRTGAADWATNEVAALAIRPSSRSVVCGCIFTIPEGELAPYLEREHRYRAVRVVAQVVPDPHAWAPLLSLSASAATPEAAAETVECWTVVAQTDEEDLASMSGASLCRWRGARPSAHPPLSSAGGRDEWQERVGQFYPSGRLWGRPDVLPMPAYLSACVHAAEGLGGQVLPHPHA